MQCVILAGGLATRMRPLTDDIPKALIPVAGRPFIEHQLAWLAGHGVTDVVLSVGYRGDMLRAHLGDGARFGLRVRTVDEGSDLRGTAGALRLALDQGVLEDAFLVTYGDSFLPVDFGAVFRALRASGRPALMTVFANGGRWDSSNAIFDGRSVVLYDKQRRTRPAGDFAFIDYGLLGFERRLIAGEVPAGTRADLADLLFALSRRGDLAGLEVHQRFYEIGSPHGLAEASSFLGTLAQTSPSGFTLGRSSAPPAEALIVLDRDGVLNRTVPNPAEARPDSPLRVEEVQLFPWVPWVLRDLTAAGFGLCIASNQPAFAKGKATREALEAVHATVVRDAEAAGGVILSSHLCLHRAEDGCACRKPATGLLAEAFARHAGRRPAASWMVGDRATDVLAGAALGMRTAYLGAGWPEDDALLVARAIRPFFRGTDLRDFARFILEGQHA